jgi:hypothetical protein
MWSTARSARKWRGRPWVVAAACVLAGMVAGCASGSGFCANHTCIANFDNGHGYIVQCADGEWSHSGGESGACSDHGGETANTAGGSSFSPSPSPASPPAPSGVSDFCSAHTCIPNFYNGDGYIVQCQDGEWSHSGGEPGACSYHGGVSAPGASTSAPSLQSSRPAPPLTTETLPTPTEALPTTPQTVPTIPKPPPSNPVLTGPTTASSNGYSMTITSFKADHTLDLAGYAGTPTEFGLNVSARCQDPHLADVWKVADGTGPTEATFMTCINGSFGSAPPPLVVHGCGLHTLIVVVQEAGSNQPLAGPMRFPFRVC